MFNFQNQNTFPYNTNNIQSNNEISQNNLNNDNNDNNINIEDPNLNLKNYIPERTIFSYYNSNFLSDALLKGNNFSIPCHKIILSAASNFVNEYLKNSNEKEIPIPELIESNFSKSSPNEAIDIILKYIYSNQNIEEIKNLINEYNIFTILQFSHSLGILNLNHYLEDLIIQNHINNETVSKLINDSILFELPKLENECVKYLSKNFGNVINNSKDDILNYDFDTFRNLVSSEEIDTEGEKEICDLIKEYIEIRRNLPSEVKIDININQPKIEEKKEEEKKEEEKKEDEQKMETTIEVK